MDERIERIRKHVQGGCYDHYPEYGRVPAINDLDSIESDLASLREQLAEAIKTGEGWRQVVRDHTEEEEMIRDILRPYFTEFELEGDSYGVPGIVQWAETLVAKYKAVLHERNVARKALEILREPFPCPDTFCRTGGNCRQCGYDHALAMAEADIKAEGAKATAIETSEAIEAAHEHAAKSTLKFGG